MELSGGSLRWRGQVEGSGGEGQLVSDGGVRWGISLSLDPRVGLRFTVQGLGRIQVLGAMVFLKAGGSEHCVNVVI